ncbi:hypothetical protein BCR44DRAFT_1098554 [Catenaria anguillulae PL171]|uniref:Ankyrin repeat-containing domain protein n=1 Tax=Catenaria anguillulae PL171 TaxID=765915 RepID=A0A1Y2I401_9FUNG|nr:hypothetical protein BCR44DRAFT_1098554 [Catenaria anguillulae PL171]
MPWIDSTLATRVGDLWLLRQLANLAKRNDRCYRPLQYNHHQLARHAGASGNLDLVRYLIQDSRLLKKRHLDGLVQQASIHGHLHILDWVALDRPLALQTYSAKHLAHPPPHDDEAGSLHVRVLQWWIEHESLWNPRWETSRWDWHVWLLVEACLAKRMRVIEYWLGVQDSKLIWPQYASHRLTSLGWPLAAAAATGDRDWFDKVHALLPDAIKATCLHLRVGQATCNS